MFFLIAELLIPFVFSFKKEIQDKSVFLFLVNLCAVIFFVYIANRYPSYNYISMFIPFSILQSLYGFSLLSSLSTKFKPFLIAIISISIVSTVIVNLSVNWTNVYDQEKYGDFRKAYKVINDNFEEGDIILGQYLRDYYLDSSKIDDEDTFSLIYDRLLTFDEFMVLVKSSDSGFVTWESRKEGHLKDEIRDYCCENFEHLAGEDCKEELDNFNVEVFYFEN